MFHVDYLVFAEEKWMSEIGLPRHLDFPHVWTDVIRRDYHDIYQFYKHCMLVGNLVQGSGQRDKTLSFPFEHSR
jgi:hypothetical protein